MEKLTINPQNFNVLAEVTKLPTMVDGIYIGEASMATKTDTEFYFGTALKAGDRSTDVDQCPEIKEGDNIIFNQFAGYAIPTTDGYCKVIRGHDIVAIVEGKFEDMSVKTVKPTGVRILVEILNEKLVQDGIYDDSKTDPREALTQIGVVVACAKGATKYKKGTKVAFDPYCGNLILNENDCKLKTINSLDILYTV